jgi:hypothetical protein
MNFFGSSPLHKPKPVHFDKIKSIGDFFSRMSTLVHNQVMEINQSKIFAGIIIIILNISTKYVNLKLSKTVESYLKHTFSRDILVFAISWMGTRDIYIATLMTVLFIVFIDFILNEQSTYCCLPEQFTDYHVGLLDASKNTLTQEEIQQAQSILEKAKNIQKQFENNSRDSV